MIKLDVLFDPGLIGLSGLSNVNLPTLTGSAVSTSYLQAKVMLHELKETGSLLRHEA
jgi:hypothetical protein